MVDPGSTTGFSGTDPIYLVKTKKNQFFHQILAREFSWFRNLAEWWEGGPDDYNAHVTPYLYKKSYAGHLGLRTQAADLIEINLTNHRPWIGPHRAESTTH